MFSEYSTQAALEAYAHIVGIGEPRLPARYEMPSTVPLRSDYLGSFFTSIRETISDGRERAQAVHLKKGELEPHFTAVEIGSENRVGSFYELASFGWSKSTS